MSPDPKLANLHAKLLRAAAKARVGASASKRKSDHEGAAYHRGRAHALQAIAHWISEMDHPVVCSACGATDIRINVSIRGTHGDGCDGKWKLDGQAG